MYLCRIQGCLGVVWPPIWGNGRIFFMSLSWRRRRKTRLYSSVKHSSGIFHQVYLLDLLLSLTWDFSVSFRFSVSFFQVLCRPEYGSSLRCYSFVTEKDNTGIFTLQRLCPSSLPEITYSLLTFVPRLRSTSDHDTWHIK